MGSDKEKTALKNLKVFTGSLGRMMKDMAFSDKEIAKQLERIEQFKVDKERDEHDVRKQGEVLAEYQAGKKDEASRLLEFYDKLEGCVNVIKEDGLDAVMKTEE